MQGSGARARGTQTADTREAGKPPTGRGPAKFKDLSGSRIFCFAVGLIVFKVNGGCKQQDLQSKNRMKSYGPAWLYLIRAETLWGILKGVVAS